jgi:pimeloyl-ACP methyl ester carboxylesterase
LISKRIPSIVIYAVKNNNEKDGMTFPGNRITTRITPQKLFNFLFIHRQIAEFSMPSLEIGPRLSLHYQDHNPKGSPIALLLHGLGATGDSWVLQFPVLTQQGMRVLTPDARGFGRSSYPGGGVRITDLAEDMAALLCHLQVEKAHIIGISMGGTMALQLALDNPQLVDKLVLVNTFASLRPDRWNVWLYFALRFVLVHTLGLPAQAKAVAQRIFPASDQGTLRQALIEQICQADPRGYRAAMRALGLFNVSTRLSEIQCPTLVITGAKDSTVPPKNQAILANNIATAASNVPESAMLRVLSPDVFNRILLDFATKLEHH